MEYKKEYLYLNPGNILKIKVILFACYIAIAQYAQYCRNAELKSKHNEGWVRS